MKEGSAPQHAGAPFSAQVAFVVIVIAQFCGTSLWFAGNAIVTTLEQTYQWPIGATGHLTIAVQGGFIAGTLIVTLTGISDRMSPSRLFFMSCLFGAVANSIPVIDLSSYTLCMTSRVLTGISLGGIYPVGMKIAADWREQGLGDWLGGLVGALVLGTSLPHALRVMDVLHHPHTLLPVISIIALSGGILLFRFVGDGPFRKKSTRFDLRHIINVLKIPSFREPLYGYFGHMWELYTFWALVPWILTRYIALHDLDKNISLLSFVVIAVGGFGCWFGGKLSLRVGSRSVAHVALFLSGVCCVTSPLIWSASFPLFMVFMIIWGFSVVADSPQFSALVAANAPAQTRGTALTFATCAGFTITIISIQFLTMAQDFIADEYLLCLLGLGPLSGLWFGRKAT